MNNGPSHFALRQWWALFSSPISQLILVAVAALIAILGPYETGERLTLAPRIAYWLAIAATTYSIGVLINTYLDRALPTQTPGTVRVIIAGCAIGTAITPVILAINVITFAYVPAMSELPGAVVQFFAISMIISTIFYAITVKQNAAPLTEIDTIQANTPALLDRLALEKRAPLVSLSSEDHYTRIRTTAGEELVLIRLSDAMKETAPEPGLQVHRSHWIALDQVRAVTRDGDRALLSMSQGDDIPVSRANIAAIMKAGLLPQ